MGLLATIKTALGLDRVVKPSEAGELQLGPGARTLVDQLPEGRALHVATMPAADGDGFVVRAWEGTADVPRADLDGPAPKVVLTPEDRERLAGLVLEVDGDTWSVLATLHVQPRETPNPDSRLYETSRVLAEGRPAAFQRGDEAPALAHRLLVLEGVVHVLFRENTVTVQRTPDFPWFALDKGIENALRRHFERCGGPIRVEDLPDGDDPLYTDVQRVLDETVLPRIHRDGGDLKLIDVKAGVVRVELQGACHSCPAAMLTLKAGVERNLKEALPGRIVAVEAV